MIAVSLPAHPIAKRVVREPQLAAHAAARLLVGRAPVGEIEAVRNDGEALRRGDAEADEIVPYLVADGDEPSRRVREQPLDPAEDALPAAAEVAAEDVTVIGVDDGPRPSPPCGEAPSRPVAPAFAVCVWSTSGRRSPDELAQLQDRRRVRADGERPLERRQLEDADAELVRDVLHRLLPFRERPGHHQDVVSPSLLFPRELEHVERRAAHVQPGDHVHDREPPCAHAGSPPVGSAATTPSVSQKAAVNGEPPKSAAPASAPAKAASQLAGM